jgi:hypothetical protein
MNSLNEGIHPDQLHPLTEAEKTMWAESKPGERITVADAVARLAKIRARSATNDTAQGAYRRYQVCVLDDASNVYKGFGMTLAQVVADESAYYGRRVADWIRESGKGEAEFISDEPDRVVWGDFRALCILRPTLGGSFKVLYFKSPCDEEGGVL